MAGEEDTGFGSFEGLLPPPISGAEFCLKFDLCACAPFLGPKLEFVVTGVAEEPLLLCAANEGVGRFEALLRTLPTLIENLTSICFPSRLISVSYRRSSCSSSRRRCRD